MSPGTVETVLFDLDDTLCTYRNTTADLLPTVFERTGVEPFFDVQDYLGRYNEFVEGMDTIEEVRANAFSTLAEEHGHDPEVGYRVADAFNAERDHSDVLPRTGLYGTIETLRHEHEYRLGVVTNGSPEMQAQKLAALDVEHHFDVVVHGGYDTPAKPDPEPFHHALDHIGAPPERAVHVGDSLGQDIAGAQAAGLQAAWIDPDRGWEPEHEPDYEPPTPDYEIDTLHDLTRLPWE